MGSKPTEEETIALLKTTIIPKIDIEDATLEQTVAELNRLARSQGIPEIELTFSIDRRVAKDPIITGFRVSELRIRNSSLAMVSKYVSGSSKIRWWVSPGKVMFGLLDDFDEKPVSTAGEKSRSSDIPFADPRETKPVHPNDPFSPAESEEADPFAEPE